MKPKIATSFRPHGKWGDFLVCIIPLIWCINILTNSNLILRLIEWQNESSLFTIRVRGRQWYWIYKFELKNFTDIISTPKNIGNNRWQINTFGELQTADDYLHILQLRSQNKWIKNYWDKSLQETGKTNKAHIISPQEQLRINLISQYKSLNNYTTLINNSPILNKNTELFIDNHFFDNIIFTTKKTLFKYLPTYNFINKNSWSIQDLNTVKNLPLIDEHNVIISFTSTNFLNQKKQINLITNTLFKQKIFSLISNPENKKNISLIKHEDFDEYSRWVKRNQGGQMPLRFIKKPLGLESKELFESDMFKIRFNSNVNKLQHKLTQDTIYLTLKQKRYNRKKFVSPQIKYVKDSQNNKTNKIAYSGKPYLSTDKIFKKSIYDPTTQYKLIKKNKKRGELVSITLARRILRTKKTLVIPAHVNITMITNSYDIVHSWFIPGLGIKLDCVPGRSTHHTFFVDSVGFYYGQCAEICGRYHHHMPIRICALPFEQFLLWWNTYGLPKMLNTISKKRYETNYELRKYTW
jgi:heme/copper-type cytochrome/quinol oxidase subunit 2